MAPIGGRLIIVCLGTPCAKTLFQVMDHLSYLRYLPVRTDANPAGFPSSLSAILGLGCILPDRSTEEDPPREGGNAGRVQRSGCHVCAGKHQFTSTPFVGNRCAVYYGSEVFFFVQICTPIFFFFRCVQRGSNGRRLTMEWTKRRTGLALEVLKWELARPIGSAPRWAYWAGLVNMR